MQVKAGTTWAGTDRKRFVVLSVAEVDGHSWVHYREDSVINNESREYSCYADSFVVRFTPVTNEGKR